MGCDVGPQRTGSNSEGRKRAQEAVQRAFNTREDEHVRGETDAARQAQIDAEHSTEVAHQSPGMPIHAGPRAKCYACRHIPLIDPVTQPAHYTHSRIEVWDAIGEWGLNYFLGNVIKYVARADHKGNAEQDLRKAIAYLEKELSRRDADVEPKVGMVAQAFRMERDAWIDRAHAAEARVTELEALLVRVKQAHTVTARDRDRVHEMYLAADKDATNWCVQFTTEAAEQTRLRDGITTLADEYARAGEPRELPVDFKLLNAAARLRALLCPPTADTDPAGGDA